eukprot:scaffold483_cov284-Amphora_coffeaeformis.AAC.1
MPRMDTNNPPNDHARVRKSTTTLLGFERKQHQPTIRLYRMTDSVSLVIPTHRDVCVFLYARTTGGSKVGYRIPQKATMDDSPLLGVSLIGRVASRSRVQEEEEEEEEEESIWTLPWALYDCGEMILGPLLSHDYYHTTVRVGGMSRHVSFGRESMLVGWLVGRHWVLPRSLVVTLSNYYETARVYWNASTGVWLPSTVHQFLIVSKKRRTDSSTVQKTKDKC